MFNSVKVVADQCTNRHPDNVVTKVLLHHLESGGEGSLKNQDNRVSKESNFLAIRAPQSQITILNPVSQVFKLTWNEFPIF